MERIYVNTSVLGDYFETEYEQWKKPFIEKKEKSMLEQLREIRDKVSAETQNMTFSELKKYIESHLQESLFPNTVWA